MGIGIAGMYLAPFGMLISKWVALKAFVDAGNFLLVIFLAFGSATTMFYWTKWLTKLVSMHRTKEEAQDVTHRDQYFSMFIHAGCVLLLCLLFPWLATTVVNPIILELFGASHEVLSMSILTTMLVIKLGVPNVISKATSEVHGEVLKRMGATVVFPEADMAVRIGRRLIFGNLLDYVALADGVEAVSYTHLTLPTT